METEILEKRVQSYLLDQVEEKTYWKLLKNLLCLAYAYAVKTKVTELFVCSGCEEGQGNQLGHDCVMLSGEDIIDMHFDEALTLVNHIDIEMTWREFVMRSCIPSRLLHRLMQDECLREETHIKMQYCKKIKKYVHKFSDITSSIFI